MSRRIPAVVLGAGGYVGAELLRLIAAHPNFELAAAVSDSGAGSPVSAVFPHLADACGEQAFVGRDGWADSLQAGSELALFSAAPHGASAAVIAGALEDAEKKAISVHVVDSSADFRYADAQAYRDVYGVEHGAPALLSRFSCALPEHTSTVETPHIGHPGCFATAALLAAVPLVSSGLTEAEIFVTGVTGSTGSGKLPQPGTHHPQRNSNLYAYKPLAHRHSPEIAGLCEAASGRRTRVHFVPHSGPCARGIHVTLQARAREAVSEDAVRAVFEHAYKDAPFVSVIAGTPRLKDVVASNFSRIGVAADGDTVVVMSVIDNLVKGAAGGAVQWMNRLYKLPETAGLTACAPGWT